MANPFHGEVELGLEGRRYKLRLTLGALAELEEALQSESLMEMLQRFESGAFSAHDLLALLGAGVRGGGLEMADAELARMAIDGGAVAAAQAAARLLKLAFSVPE